MPLYRKKPVVIEAMQLNWGTWNEMCEFVGVGPGEDDPHGVYVYPDGSYSALPDCGMTMGLLLPTLEGNMIAREGDWIIKGVKGEFYPCKPDIFEATYDSVEEVAA